MKLICVIRVIRGKNLFFLIILTYNKPLVLRLTQPVNTGIFYLDVPFLSPPWLVPPFGIAFPDTAAIEDMTGEEPRFDEDQAGVANKHFRTYRRAKVGEGDGTARSLY